MRFPIDDLLDRISIIRLKFERIDILENKGDWIKMLIDYAIAIGEYIGEGVCTEEQAKKWLEELYKYNGNAWDYEAGIRSAKDANLNYTEIGKAAIEVRKWNRERVRVKSEIVEATGQGVKDVKQSHASAT